MRALTFQLISDDRFQYYIRRNIQEKIEEIQKKITTLDGVYIKIEQPLEIKFTEENNRQYRAICSIVKEKKAKYTWQDIMKIVNETYAPVYKFKKISDDIEEYKEIKRQRKIVKVISSHLTGISEDKNYNYSTGIFINGEKYVVDVVKTNDKSGERWIVGDCYQKEPLDHIQKAIIIDTIKNNPPVDFKTKFYIDEQIEVIEKLSNIKFEEEIQINEGKIDLYFANAYWLFLTPFEDCEYTYYDGYLTLDLNNKTADIEIVVISDNDDRIYYNYKPTKEETEDLINAADKYCKEYYGQTLQEFLNEVMKEDNENEQ